jgi:hypothetical protein
MPAGGEALREGVLEALSVPRRCYPPLQLGLANLPAVTADEALVALQQYRDALGERLAHVQARWESQQPVPPFVDMMFEYASTMTQAEKGWIEQAIVRLERTNDK